VPVAGWAVTVVKTDEAVTELGTTGRVVNIGDALAAGGAKVLDSRTTLVRGERTGLGAMTLEVTAVSTELILETT
jgi:hypothetical protein